MQIQIPTELKFTLHRELGQNETLDVRFVSAK